jgi:hypothetical protein
MLEGSIKRKASYYGGIEFSVLLVILLVLGLGFPRLTPVAGAGLALGVIAAVVALALWAWTAANFVMPLGLPVVFTLALFMLLRGIAPCARHPAKVRAVRAARGRGRDVRLAPGGEHGR